MKSLKGLTVNLVLFAVLGAVSFANANPVLEANMKAMAAAKKALITNFKDTTKRDANLLEVAKLRVASLGSVEVLPDAIALDPNLSGDAKIDLEIQYRTFMTSLVSLSVELEFHIFKLDTVAAEATLLKIDTLQKEGHKLFRPKKP